MKYIAYRFVLKFIYYHNKIDLKISNKLLRLLRKLEDDYAKNLCGAYWCPEELDSQMAKKLRLEYYSKDNKNEYL